HMLKREKYNYSRLVLIPPALATLIGWFTDSVTSGFHPTEWGLMHEPGPLFIPLTLICSALPAEIAIFMVFKNLNKARNKAERKQRYFVLWGSAVVLHVGVATNLFIPHTFNNPDFIQLASFTATLFAFFLFQAVIKYDLLPISAETIISELFSGSSHGLVIVDETNNIVQMNSTAENLLHMTKTQWLSTAIEQAIPDLKSPQNKQQSTIDLSHSYGYPCLLQITIDRHINNGRPNGWVYTIADITKEHLAAEEVKELNNSLEQRVKDRTLELEQSQVRLLMKTNELEESSRYKTEFMAKLSHELRTPMNAVLGSTDLLLYDDKLDYEKKLYLDTIKISSLNLLDLLNDLLDFSKIENGHLEYESFPVNIEQTLYQVCDMLRSKLDSENKELYLLIEHDLFECALYTDSVRFC
ncbi:MAG: hypothetical protein HRT88_01025, partial [Lentisphaeraceae bacterium]|nr:hypothetical protein [Lentisphaeraceae bacterium]